MDLGELVTGLGTAYLQARYAPVPQVTPVGLPIPGTGYTIEGDIPFIDIGRRTPTRRRRKPLLTASDESALLRIQALLAPLSPAQQKTMMPIILKAVRR